MNTRWETVAEAARRHGLTERQVRTALSWLRQRSQIVAVRDGGNVRYTREDVDYAVRTRRKPGRQPGYRVRREVQP